MAKIHDDIKIAGNHTVKDWKRDRIVLLKNPGNDQLWQNAFNVFRARVKSRFLSPIEKILSGNENKGEGFSAVAIQCILVEFLEAFYQGKVYAAYSPDDELESRAAKLGLRVDQLRGHNQPNEYSSSSKLFRDFLTGHEPFRTWFDRNSKAAAFYTDFRCGLLHEAATKKTAIIRAGSDDGPIIEKDSNSFILYRNSFQKAILSFVEAYFDDLLVNDALKLAFIRKMDDICQIARAFYFAYGSNMKTERLKERIGNVHNAFRGELRDFEFLYNKKSVDGSSKANIRPGVGQTVHGVCFEIDEASFEDLKTCEKGYDLNEVPIFTPDGNLIISRTFISESLSAEPPTKEYVGLVIEGAKKYGLPDDYISTALTP
jgi:gamma-glutamylcyclotransferase (GGCT)/AIG2-like uncharacterized protein YtfP